MTNRERPPEPLFDIPAALAAAGIGMGPVEPGRRLIPQTPEMAGRAVELYSSAAGSRLLAMPHEGVDGRLHDELSVGGMPVLPRYEGSSAVLDLLLVPIGTWPLGARLHIMRRDFYTYSGMLLEVARSQRLQYERGMGVVIPTEHRRTVDHFAFTPDLRTATGQQLYMIPPYNTDPDATPDVFAHAFTEELAASGEFDERQMDYLRQAIMWEAVGDAQA